MAAPCSLLVRSSVKGLHYVSSAHLCFKTSHAQSWSCFGSGRFVSQHRALHCSTTRFLNKTDAAETPEEDSGPEYIPKRKAKNPMTVIGYAWIIGLPSGIIGFVLAKRQVDKNRLEQLRIRQRMKKSNEGEYERERYKPAAGMQ